MINIKTNKINILHNYIMENHCKTFVLVFFQDNSKTIFIL